MSMSMSMNMNTNPTIEEFKSYTNSNYEFSEFQVNACNAILENKHVLVTAHTGSGKTLPAEFSIYYQIKHLNKKVIYTSPIKALSNQKFKEFSKKFPDINVGILTGDIKHNPDADLLIVTTEILQNHCFKINHKQEYLDFNIDLQNELGSVVFDEVHYIDDQDRGTVWEQTMIMLPNHVPFVMLSATIGEKETFASWIQSMKGKEVVICSTNHRVVPLEFYEYFKIPDKYVDVIKDKNKKKMFQDKLQNNFNLIKNDKEYNKSVLNITKKCLHEIEKDKVFIYQKYIVNECLNYLKNNDLFPSLLFVFSRKKVDLIASQITTNLFLEDEKDYKVEPIFRQMLVSKVNNWKEYISLPEYQTYLDLLEKGIGVHHAGMLPIFRETMEILYEQKYIKVLIATETFAIGLNMPTRTVIFSSLYKHDGVQSRPLKSHEFIQMAGRAGRRNIDTKGHVVMLTNCYDPLDEVSYYNLFHSTPKVLQSKFKINYNLILNFLENKTQDEFVSMIENSLMNLDIKKQINLSNFEITSLNNKINEQKAIIDRMDFDVDEFFSKYFTIIEKSKSGKNKERKKYLRQKNDMEISEKDKLQHVDLYTTKNILIEKLDREKNVLEYSKTFIKNQIEIIFKILKDNCYMNDENKLTNNGLNASYIHEMPCLVFMDFYEQYLKLPMMNEVDLLCIFSCFYDLKVRDDEKIFNPEFMQNELKFIQDKINYYIDYELKNELYISTKYKLQYDLMEYMRKWYNEVSNQEECLCFFNDMKQNTTIFIGDFIKACLKISNMMNEIKIVCNNDNNYELLEMIENIQNNIQKFIVSNKSLYL